MSSDNRYLGLGKLAVNLFQGHGHRLDQLACLGLTAFIAQLRILIYAKY